MIDAADGKRLTEAILGLKPVDPRCRIEIVGGMNRPPFVESEPGLALYEKARTLAREKIGLEIGKQRRGGGSDANFTAALGAPTLDGLGCPGGGAHAAHEHILLARVAASRRAVGGADRKPGVTVRRPVKGRATLKPLRPSARWLSPMAGPTTGLQDFVGTLAGNLRDIMVADESLRHEAGEKRLWRSKAQASSKKLRSLSELQIAFHNLYWVTESTLLRSTKST